MNNDIIIRKPEGKIDYSPLRHIIIEQLKIFSYGEANPLRHETLFPMICDYYNERARNTELADYIRMTGDASSAESMGSCMGNPAAYEYVCAVEDARWAGAAMPAWREREFVRHEGNFFGRELPESGLVSLAFHTGGGSASICCPHIAKIPLGDDAEYFDFEDNYVDFVERAFFYGNYYEHADGSPRFDFWYTDNEALIAQMHDFIDNLAECYLDTDSMVYYPK